MQSRNSKASHGWAVLAGLSLLATSLPAAWAQLAITEVMASACTNLSGQYPDFWELTNFSTNAAEAIDLTGYTFADSDHTKRFFLVKTNGPALSIAPGESILFVCTTPPFTNEMRVREWWGAGLKPGVKIRFYGKNPGLSGSAGDSLQLYDRQGNLLDAVDFGISQAGVTFTYDADGQFGVRSVLGTSGVFRAAIGGDIGSPGVTSGPIPLRILEPPTNQLVCAGLEAVFSVRAAGLPRPRYQWFFQGQPIPGAVERQLKLSPVLPADAGEYSVALTTGLETLRSAGARLIVSTNPAAPLILEPPSDLQVFDGQKAHFSARISGYPPPVLQWFADDAPLVGENNLDLLVWFCTPELSGTAYCLQASNVLGSARACARLEVITPPFLEVTEVMANPSADPAGPGEDWFELTNFSTNTVNLRGWRFSDLFNLQTALVITQSVNLRPGQSMIFAKRLTPEQFANWWGPDNLPAGLPILTFAGFSLSAAGEDLYFWNPAAEDGLDGYIDRCFNQCQPGISLELCVPGAPNGGCNSQFGQGGAFYAALGSDLVPHALGSPGYIRNPEPEFLAIEPRPAGLALKWRAVAGKTYNLWFKDALGDPTWQSLGTFPATNPTAWALDSAGGATRQRFYRLEQWP